ncbi:MAG: DUF2164 domain-containing protein [Gammaproteobacteria bacterium]|nr:DUF2164 domain-containing protein [Gammaproteobacteria bacterium]
MKKIEFTQDEKELLARKIQMYFSEELDQEIGGFDAQFLLDFFAEESARLWYNQGLQDAQAVIGEQVANVSDAIYELTQVTELERR